MVVFQLSED